MRKLFLVAGLVAVTLFGGLVWPTPYRYERTRISQYGGGEKLRLVRISRLTGHAQYLDDLGWLNLQP